ncbi:eCIS core domain-containing protein [Cyclobacterium roseum]|uniref:eCIS core domain-containing protein n=1 Tax=Cyclobacterium roseum TaxID=2666137 RepID=UPI001391D99A|nr:DUF4157 domain-containing protein [Cyclobacterium roseum]
MKVFQRTSGKPNQAPATEQSGDFFQAKLQVGQPGDKYEQEADAMADQVVQRSSESQLEEKSGSLQAQEDTVNRVQKKEHPAGEVQAQPLAGGVTPVFRSEAAEEPATEEEIVQKQEEKEVHRDTQSGEHAFPAEEDAGMLQRKEDANSEISTHLESQISQKSGGSAMDPTTRKGMESGFGADFSQVNIHTDAQAVQMSQDLGAQAFTHGRDIYFNEGKYNPSSQSGQHLLAHELTHTLQQGASTTVQKSIIQKTEDQVSEPVSNSHFFTDQGTREDYSIDTSLQTITIPKIGVPRFKVPFGPNTRFQLPVGGPNRQNNHLTVWETSAMSGSGFSDEFSNKIRQENPPPLAEIRTPVYYLTLKGGSARETRGQSDGEEGVIFGSEATIKRRISRPYWTSSGQYKPHDVDHKRELQLGGNETDLQNMWMLESSANRSSGSLINNEINRRIRLALTESNDFLLNPPDFDTVKSNYAITVENGVAAGRGMNLASGADSNQYWSLDSVKEGRHLRGLKFFSEAEVEAAGLRGSPNELVLYSNATGGRMIKIPWDETARSAGRKDGLSELGIFIGKRGGANLRIDSVIYTSATSGEEQGGNGAVICTAFPGADGMIREKTNLAFTINPDPGVSYGGVISRPSVLQAALHALELRQLSPITLSTAELDDEVGLKASGTIAPTVPLISNAGITIEIDSDGVRISKIFSASDFNFPSPFTISNTSLEIFAGTAGLGIAGEVNFEINQVGEGHIGAAASTSGGFELEGAFNFDSELFDPAEINVEYKENTWTIGGEIGIPEGKVRGVKSATITASYSENNFAASAEAELDIPGIERGSMDIQYGEAGFSIGGNFDLSSDIPGITGGNVEARVSKPAGAEAYEVFVSGTAQPDIPGITTSLAVTYENGALTIEGSASYSRGMLSGTIEVGATNRPIGEDGQPAGEPDESMRVYGGGELTLQLTPWLAATAGVRLLPTGEIEVNARLASESYEVFRRREFNRNLFRVPTIEIPLFAIPLGPRSIGLVAQIGGGLDFTAGFGPGELRNLSAEITYNPEREEETTVAGHGEFAIPADAGLTLRGDLGLGVSVAIASLSGGIELTGTLGLEGEALAEVDVNWSPQTGLALDASGRITVNPKFVFEINAFARASLGVGFLSISETWRHNLAAYEWGPGIQFGIVFPVHYREGEPFDMSFDDIEVIYPDLDVIDMAKGLASDIKDDLFA